MRRWTKPSRAEGRAAGVPPGRQYDAARFYQAQVKP